MARVTIITLDTNMDEKKSLPLSNVGATVILPFTPVAEVFGFTGLTPLYLLVVGLIVLLYSLAAEVVKKIFYKRVKLY